MIFCLCRNIRNKLLKLYASTVAFSLRLAVWWEGGSPTRKPSDSCRLKIVHVSPSYFDDASVIGGGERYAQSLAGAMARKHDAVLVSFGRVRNTLVRNGLRLEIYPAMGLIDGMNFNPLNISFLRELLDADVIHCHQHQVVVTNLAVLFGTLWHIPVFVTDLGGWSYNYAGQLKLDSFVQNFLAISRFSTAALPLGVPYEVIYGGVDDTFLHPRPGREKGLYALYVGRVTPHKGVNYLVEAVGEDLPLRVIGRIYHRDYFALLTSLAAGGDVRFQDDASDDDLAAAYQGALVTVLPSVYLDIYGAGHAVPELLGLVLLESMACGTPVICTAVGAMPEIVRDGVTGFIVPPNDPAALREKILWLRDHPKEAKMMGETGRELVRARFRWETVAERCYAAYVEGSS